MSVYKSKYFVPALSLALLAAMFTFDGSSVQWMWSGSPIVAVLLGATSLTFWGLLLLSRKSHG